MSEAIDALEEAKRTLRKVDLYGEPSEVVDAIQGAIEDLDEAIQHIHDPGDDD